MHRLSNRPAATRSDAGHDRLGVVDQVVLACHPRNRLATALGFLGGGAVPAATYAEAHFGLDLARPLHLQVTTWAVLGGLLFSAKTVFNWAKLAFRDSWKAAGYVVLLEGIMITSRVPVLPLVLLVILVAINGVATGCTLGLDRSRSLPRLLKTAATLARLPIATTAIALRRSDSEPVAGAGRRSRRSTSTASTDQERFEFHRRSAAS